MSEKRKTKVTKSIKRIYNVAQFESLVIEVTQEDEIEWETLEERQSKCGSMTQLLVDDFGSTRRDVMTELNASENKAYFTKALASMGGSAKSSSNDDLLG